MWVESIRVDGVELGLEQWLARMRVRSGRGTVHDEPTASTCDLVLLDPPRELTRTLTVGQSLDVDANDGLRTVARFRGRITDLELVDPQLTVTAAGLLAELNRMTVSTTGWTREPWSATVARLFEACGLTPADYRVTADTAFDPDLEPPPEADIAVTGYLAELALTIGAAVYDEPDGTIVADAIGARDDPGRLSIVGLSPSTVRYSPVWRQELDIVNRVQVYYGPARDTSVTVSDPLSIDEFGLRRLELPTTLFRHEDAERRAADLLDRRSWPRWQIQPIDLTGVAFGARIGWRVAVSELPSTAPYATWAPVVEGMVDVIDGPDYHQELAVSDPLSSGFSAKWQEAGATTTWDELRADMRWFELSDPEDLGGS